MTHHILKSLAAVALGAMLLTGSVVAQSGYYQVGDTVRGKCPIYHYENGWWPTLNASGHTDSLIGTIGTFGYMKHTTNTPLKVIGVASTVARLDITTMQEDLDTSIDGTLYYVLLDATAGGPVELTRVCWTDDYSTHPTRYLELPRRGGESCDQMLDYTVIVPLREYYFDSAITVTDSFYLGCATTDPTVTDFNSFSYIASHMWDYCTYAVSPDGTPNPSLKPCATDMPEFIYYDSSRLDNQWHHFTYKRFQLIFPIIELDTTPVQPDTVWRTVTALSADDSLGEVTGGGIYPDSSWVTITANPYALDCIGCHIEFDHWNDGDTTNPRLVFVISDTSFTAYFRVVEDSTESINKRSISHSQFSIYPNPATHQVSIECAETISEAWLTDLTGRREQVRLTAEAPGRYTLDLTARPQATYLLTLTTASGETHTVRLLKQSDIFSR